MPLVTGVAQAGNGFGTFCHLHQTHAAVGGDRKYLVVTKIRGVLNANLLRGVHHRAAVGHLHLFAVDFDF